MSVTVCNIGQPISWLWMLRAGSPTRRPWAVPPFLTLFHADGEDEDAPHSRVEPSLYHQVIDDPARMFADGTPGAGELPPTEGKLSMWPVAGGVRAGQLGLPRHAGTLP